MYQTTTSLGLAQVQPRSPKAAVVTGAAARALKNGITFLPKIKSSSPIKYEHIRPLSHGLDVQSIKFGIGLVDVRTSTNEHLRGVGRTGAMRWEIAALTVRASGQGSSRGCDFGGSRR